MRVLLRLWLAATLATAFPLAAPAQTYPSVPVLTSAGPLSCGLRMYSAGMAQAYCLFNAPPAPVVTVCNSLSAISPAASGGLPLGVALSCNATDLPNLLFYSVTWLLYADSGGVQYQVTWSAVPCQPPITSTSNLVAGCIAAAPASPSTFQSGILQ